MWLTRRIFVDPVLSIAACGWRASPTLTPTPSRACAVRLPIAPHGPRRRPDRFFSSLEGAAAATADPAPPLLDFYLNHREVAPPLTSLLPPHSGTSRCGAPEPTAPKAEEEPLQPEPCSRPLKLLHSSHLGGISATSRLSLPQVLYGAFDALGGNQPLPARRTGPPSPSLPPAPLVGLTDFAFPDRGRRGKARRVPTGSAALLLHPCGGSSASSRVQP